MEFTEIFSTPIGLIDDGEFSCVEFQLGVGDRLMLYSDGITECPDLDENLLNEAGLEQIMRNHAKLRGLQFVEATVDQLAEFSGRQDFPDDLSAILIERV